MGICRLTIEELVFVIPFQKRPKIGALICTMLRPGTLGLWGDGLVSEEGAMTKTATSKSYKKWKLTCVFLLRFLSVEPPPVHMEGTL